jgi:hypothetical protein
MSSDERGIAMADIDMTVSYNRYLPPGGTAVSALVSVPALAGHRIDRQHELRLWTPLDANVVSVRQVQPVVRDLTGARTAVTTQVCAYPVIDVGDRTGAYLIDIEVDPDDVGCEIRAARIEVVDRLSGDILGSATVVVEWTEDDLLSVLIDPQVALHSDREQLCRAIESGVEAARYNDTDRAVALVAAQRLAESAGDEARRLQLSWIYTGLKHSSMTEQTKYDPTRAPSDTDTMRMADDISDRGDEL